MTSSVQSLSSEARQEAAGCRHRRPAAGALPHLATEENDHGTGRLGPCGWVYIFWLSDSHHLGTVRLLTLRTAPSFHPIREKKSRDYLIWQRHKPRSLLQHHKNNSETVRKSDEP